MKEPTVVLAPNKAIRMHMQWVRVACNHRLLLPRFFADHKIFRNSRSSLANGLIIESSVSCTPDVVLSGTGRATLALSEAFPH